MTAQGRRTMTAGAFESVHMDRITGGSATRRVKYGDGTGWHYESTTNGDWAEVEYWNPQTGHWE